MTGALAQRLIEAEIFLRGLGGSATVHAWKFGGGWLAAVTYQRDAAHGDEPRELLAEALCDAADALREKLAAS